MLENLAARVNGDANLVRRGRNLTTTFLLAIDSTDHLVSVADGKITRTEAYVTPSAALEAAGLSK